MAFLRCNTCGGRYEDVLADGMRYFHVCPPLTLTELKDGLRDRSIVLPVRAAATVDELTLADLAQPLALDSPSRVDMFLTTLVVERPLLRNENVDLAKAKAALDDRGRRKSGTTDESLVRASGKGVTVLG